MAFTLTVQNVRTKTGNLELPHFTSFVGPVQTYKQLRQCGVVFDDQAVNVLGDVSTLSQSGSAAISAVLGGGTFDWSYTWAPTTDNLDGSWTYTLTLTAAWNGVAGSSVSNLKIKGPGATPVKVNGDTEVLIQTQYGTTWSSITADLAAPGHAFTESVVISGKARAPGYRFGQDPFTTTICPHQYLKALRSQLNFDYNNCIWRDYAAYDVPVNPTQISFCGPQNYSTGLCPYRHTEWQCIAGGLTPAGTNRTAHFKFEWRAIGSVGAWSTVGMSDIAFTFKPKDTTHLLPWVAVLDQNIENQRGGTFANEFRLAATSNVT